MSAAADTSTLDQIFERAVALHKDGHLAEAENIYRQILAVDSNHADSLHMLGMVAHQRGQGARAVELIGQALALRQVGAYWTNLAVVLIALDRLDEARAACERAIALNPEMNESYLNLGVVFEKRARPLDAARWFRQAIDHGRDTADIWFRLGTALQRAGNHADALPCFDTVLAKGRNDAAIHFSRASALHELRRYDEAIAAYRQALDLNPGHAEAALGMGLVYEDMKQIIEAESMLKLALDIAPGNPIVLYNLSRVHKTMGRVTAAINAAAGAIESKPGFAGAHMALGNALHAGGKIDQALAAFRRGVALDPDNAEIHDNLIACLRYDAHIEGTALRDEYRAWDAKHLGKIARLSHANTPNPQRRLRVGYLSPDFRTHSVAYFLEPLLAAHDRTQFEVFCYSQVDEKDDTTKRFEALADRWREILYLDDDRVAVLIQSDAIDILVDCAGHTQGKRMRVFARKPAPVQVATLIGHEATTGMSAMDYIMGDPHLTPPGYEAHFSETLIRLPKVIAPFQPRDEWPEVAPMPDGETVVFGCFAEPSRIGEITLDMWKRILDRVPGARLLLKHKTYGYIDQARYWREGFAALEDRFDLEGLPGGWIRNMDVYGRISVMLDTFPLTGATTTLIPLWMGVPVISLAGKHSGQRYGASMLCNAGVPELLATDQNQYVDLAVALATDRARLSDYRRVLRDTVRSAPIMDARTVTRAIEESYRQMWRHWCATRSATGI